MVEFSPSQLRHLCERRLLKNSYRNLDYEIAMIVYKVLKEKKFKVRKDMHPLTCRKS